MLSLAAACLLGCAPAWSGSSRFDELAARGRSLRAAEKYAQAAEAFEAALAARPGDRDVATQLADVDIELGRYSRAASLLSDVLGRAPGDYWACTQLARVDVLMGRLDLAKDLYARAMRLDQKDARAYIAEGYAFLDAGRQDDAKRTFQRLIAADPASPYGYHHLAVYYNRLGRYGEAERAMRMALERLNAQPRPDRDAVLHATVWLGGMLAEQGKSSQAEKVYREGLRQAAGYPTYAASLFIELGDLLASQARSRQAEDCFKSAVRSCETPGCMPMIRGRALAALAEFYANSGDKRQAQAQADLAWGFEKSLGRSEALDWGNTRAMDRLGSVYERLGERGKAEQVYRYVLLIGQGVPTSDAPQAAAALAALRRKEGRP